MSLLDTVEEDIPLTRHEIPAKRLNHKRLHRFRHIYKHDGTISRVLLVDSDESFVDEKDKVFSKVEKFCRNDDSGLPTSNLHYSLGKRKRWHLVKELEERLPRPEGPVASTSVLTFEEQRSDNSLCVFDCCPRVNQSRNPCYYNYRSHLKGYSVNDGEQQTSRHGKFSHRLNVLQNRAEREGPKIHVQYQVTEFALNRKIHNSDGYRIWRTKPERCKAAIEGFTINKDVLKTGDCEYRTEFNELNCNESMELDNVSDEVHGRSAPGMTLADFMVTPRRKNRRNMRKSTETTEEWEIVR